MKITVIGLGLIGGSMALDLKARGFCTRVIGVDSNAEHCKQALKLGIADEIKSLSKKIFKPSKAIILFDDSPDKLVESVMAELEKRK